MILHIPACRKTFFQPFSNPAEDAPDARFPQHCAEQQPQQRVQPQPFPAVDEDEERQKRQHQRAEHIRRVGQAVPMPPRAAEGQRQGERRAASATFSSSCPCSGVSSARMLRTASRLS